MTDGTAATADMPRAHWPRLVIAALALAALVSLVFIYRVTYQRGLDALVHDAGATARLQVAVLQSELDKQRSVPVILAEDSDVVRSLTDPSPDRSLAISRKLARLQAETHSAVIYVVNDAGSTLSASNFALPTSFVGSNYSFRDYFRQALSDGQAEQFALGTVSRRPGLYLAHRVESGGRALGVVVVKVEFDTVEQAWARANNATFVTDAAGNVLITSQPSLRFHKGPAPARDQIAAVLPAPGQDWKLNLISSRQDVIHGARGATLTAAMGELLIIFAVAWLWRRQKLIQERAAAESRYREKLEHNVAVRTQELSATNTRLSQEIRDRQQAEQRLNRLQADLVQANKLASLGQITAGVAHEINQPLATLRVLAENALAVLGKGKAKADPLVTENLGNIVRMSERIGHITGELRTFSRKGEAETEPVVLKDTVESSILLNQSRLRDNRVGLERDNIDPALQVMAGRIRLEQVLVNLLQNACEALEDRADPCVRLTVAVDGPWVILSVIDNGPGIRPEVMEQLFTPFVTTKPKGLGLGLVIAHDILRDFGGELSARTSDQGAAFRLRLRRVTS